MKLLTHRALLNIKQQAAISVNLVSCSGMLQQSCRQLIRKRCFVVAARKHMKSIIRFWYMSHILQWFMTEQPMNLFIRTKTKHNHRIHSDVSSAGAPPTPVIRSVIRGNDIDSFYLSLWKGLLINPIGSHPFYQGVMSYPSCENDHHFTVCYWHIPSFFAQFNPSQFPNLQAFCKSLHALL